MKNFLWFLRKPTDEREQLLYLQAYRRVLYFLFGILVFGSLLTGANALFDVFDFQLEKRIFSVPVVVLDTAIDLTFLICIFLGWHVLRKEELDVESKKIVHKQNVWVILGSLILVLILSYLVTQVFPQSYIPIYLIGLGVAWLILSVFSYRSLTQTVPLLLRIYLSIFYPLFVLVFSRISSKMSVVKFILSGIYTFVLHILLFLSFSFAVIFTIIFSSQIFPPHLINTNHFVPDFQSGDRVQVQRNFESLNVNDFVIFLGSTGRSDGTTQPRLGKVISIEPSIVVDSSIGEVTIDSKHRIIGKVTSKINIGNGLFAPLPMTIVADGESIMVEQ